MAMNRQKDKIEMPCAKKIMWSTLIFIWLAMTSCSHWREAYLDDGINEVNSKEVAKVLGKPWRTKTSLLNGKTTLTYRYVLAENQLNPYPMGLESIGRGLEQLSDATAGMLGKTQKKRDKDKPICIHYLLTFNKSTLLEGWERKDCSGNPL